RRLRVRRLLQFFFRALEAHLRNGKSQRLVRFFKNGARHGVFSRQFFSHSRVLRSLPRKYKRHFSHNSSLRLFPHRPASPVIPSEVCGARNLLFSSASLSVLCVSALSFRLLPTAPVSVTGHWLTSDNSSSIFSFMCDLASPAATRIAFFTAL